uniref:Arrestin_N domain-containing protein n=1 Tax=Mesocestoides corti TaxID=53468 RepID=A0A5K3EZE0_MESCO
MDEFEVVAQIPEPPTFLCDEVVRCEVVVTRANTQTKWDIRSVEGILVGQYRLNTVAIAQNLQSHHEFAQIVPRKLPGGDYRLDSVFDAGLDPQSRVSWIGHLKSGTQFPFFAIDEKSCTKITLRARLPEHLPPSYRGNIIRFAYKALIQVQVGNISPRLLHLPFRVLPSVRAYYHSSPSLSAVSSTISVTLPVLMGSDYHGSLITSDRDSNPFRNDSTGQFGCGTSPLGDGCLSREELHPAVFDRLSQLLTEAQMSYSNRSHGTKKARGRKKRIRKESPSRLPSAMFAEMVSSSSVATFVISGPNGHICRIGFFKTAARLGDSLRGFLDFQAAAVPCFECVIRATTNEYFDLSFQQENTLEKDLLFFTTPIEVPRDSREKGNY